MSTPKQKTSEQLEEISNKTKLLSMMKRYEENDMVLSGSDKEFLSKITKEEFDIAHRKFQDDNGYKSLLVLDTEVKDITKDKPNEDYFSHLQTPIPSTETLQEHQHKIKVERITVLMMLYELRKNRNRDFIHKHLSDITEEEFNDACKLYQHKYDHQSLFSHELLFNNRNQKQHQDVQGEENAISTVTNMTASEIKRERNIENLLAQMYEYEKLIPIPDRDVNNLPKEMRELLRLVTREELIAADKLYTASVGRSSTLFQDINNDMFLETVSLERFYSRPMRTFGFFPHLQKPGAEMVAEAKRYENVTIVVEIMRSYESTGNLSRDDIALLRTVAKIELDIADEEFQRHFGSQSKLARDIEANTFYREATNSEGNKIQLNLLPNLQMTKLENLAELFNRSETFRHYWSNKEREIYDSATEAEKDAAHELAYDQTTKNPAKTTSLEETIYLQVPKIKSREEKLQELKRDRVLVGESHPAIDEWRPQEETELEKQQRKIELSILFNDYSGRHQDKRIFLKGKETEFLRSITSEQFDEAVAEFETKTGHPCELLEDILEGKLGRVRLIDNRLKRENAQFPNLEASNKVQEYRRYLELDAESPKDSFFVDG